MENKKLEEFKKNIAGKNVAVIGIGISNIPAIKYLIKLGAKVSARDKKENLSENLKELKDLNIEFVLGENYLSGLEKYDYIFRSPGVKPFTYEIERAVEEGSKLTSEIEKVIELAPCKVIGVTGSDGKTTTTTLISKFLEKAGYKVWVGGNIGTPLFSSIEEIKKDDIIVLELSSFQLMTLTSSPDVSVITNVSPNHLDYHRSYNEYIMAKANIFLNQAENSNLILNLDDEFTPKYIQLAKERNVSINIYEFSVKDETKKGVFLKDENIVSNLNGKEEKICSISDVKLVGVHNLANICAASCAVNGLVSNNDIKDVVSTFNGVEHRMELTRIKNDITWYNDSIGTSPTRTIAGLKSFKQKVILIAGGYDKKIPYEPLAPYIIEKVKHLILVGKTSEKIKDAVFKEAKEKNIDIDKVLNIVEFETLADCVNYANKIAIKNDIVVMSPASASFDMYKNFEERGNYFKELVNKL